MTVYSFICKVKPKSYNSWGSVSVAKKAFYRDALVEAFTLDYAAHLPLQENLYGLVYHFYKEDINIDADNLSKPVWDCLRAVLFDDDKRVKMRIAGSFNLSNDYLGFIGSSGLSSELITRLLDALETEDHVLYVECGVFSPNMLLLNIGNYAN